MNPASSIPLRSAPKWAQEYFSRRLPGVSLSPLSMPEAVCEGLQGLSLRSSNWLRCQRFQAGRGEVRSVSYGGYATMNSILEAGVSVG